MLVRPLVILLTVTFTWELALVSVFAQGEWGEPFDGIPLDDSYPDGIAPSHVFAKAELLNRSLDRVIEVWNEQELGTEIVRIDDTELLLEVESELKPMHVYQTMLTCAWRLQQVDDHSMLQARHMPTLASRPRVYAPRDVFLVVAMMLENVQRIGSKLKIAEMPASEQPVAGKTPTDVFYQGVRTFMRLNALYGREDLQPSEVFSQLSRAGKDARTILRQTDPACRYRIDRPENDKPRDPADVFAKCLQIRKLINKHADALGMQPTPVPESPQGLIRPRDVFFQTQIIIAELNLMKLHLGTVSSTPLAIEASKDTTPSDAYQQGLMVEYLLQQIDSGAVLQLADRREQ